MTTDECRLILNLIDNIRLIAESTDFVTQHPVSRDTVAVVPKDFLLRCLDRAAETMENCIAEG